MSQARAAQQQKSRRNSSSLVVKVGSVRFGSTDGVEEIAFVMSRIHEYTKIIVGRCRQHGAVRR